MLGKCKFHKIFMEVNFRDSFASPLFESTENAINYNNILISLGAFKRGGSSLEACMDGHLSKKMFKFLWDVNIKSQISISPYPYRLSKTNTKQRLQFKGKSKLSWELWIVIFQFFAIQDQVQTHHAKSHLFPFIFSNRTHNQRSIT